MLAILSFLAVSIGVGIGIGRSQDVGSGAVAPPPTDAPNEWITPFVWMNDHV